jgi:hypothetical protein
VPDSLCPLKATEANKFTVFVRRLDNLAGVRPLCIVHRLQVIRQDEHVKLGGFACFGVALSLELSKSDLAAARALGTGQTTGTLADLNGDLLPDLLAVDRQQGVWVRFGESERSRRFQAIVSLADPASGPRTVTAVMGRRRLGTWVIRPGMPTIIGMPKAGPLTLRWRRADGTPESRGLVIVRPIGELPVNDVLAFIDDNRVLRDFTCEEREQYRIRPLCDANGVALEDGN